MTELKTPKLVLRVQRRTLEDIPGFAMHESRSGGNLRHVDPERTKNNRVLIGSGHPARDLFAAFKDLAVANLEEEVKALRKSRGKKAAAAREAKGPQKPFDPKNNRPWTEVLVSASPQYFSPNGEPPGQWNEQRTEAFIQRVHDVLTEKFGDGVVHLSVHLDEETVHAHAAILPIIEKTSKRRGRQRLVSHRSHPEFFTPDVPKDALVDALGNPLEGVARREKRLELQADVITGFERFQDSMGAAFADLGIERGERHAERRRVDRFLGAEPDPAPVHRTTKEWRALQKAELKKQEQCTRDIEREAREAREATARALKSAAEAAGAKERTEAAEKKAAARLAEAEATQRAATEKLVKAEAIERGIEAILAGDLVHDAPRDSVKVPEERLSDETRALPDAIRPAISIVTRLASKVARVTDNIRSRLFKALETREARVARREAALADRENAIRGAETIILAAAQGIERERAKLDRRKPNVITMADILAEVASGEWAQPSQEDQAEMLRQLEDVVTLPKPKTQADRMAEDRKLSRLTNKQLRQAYHATESAASLLDETPADFERGPAMMYHESERRGVDLSNGKQDVCRATEPLRARLHRDEDLRPLQVLRRETRQRQLVRG